MTGVTKEGEDHRVSWPESVTNVLLEINHDDSIPDFSLLPHSAVYGGKLNQLRYTRQLTFEKNQGEWRRYSKSDSFTDQFQEVDEFEFTSDVSEYTEDISHLYSSLRDRKYRKLAFLEGETSIKTKDMLEDLYWFIDLEWINCNLVIKDVHSDQPDEIIAIRNDILLIIEAEQNLLDLMKQGPGKYDRYTLDKISPYFFRKEQIEIRDPVDVYGFQLWTVFTKEYHFNDKDYEYIATTIRYMTSKGIMLSFMRKIDDTVVEDLTLDSLKPIYGLRSVE